ncbi:MAG: tRNA (adenosine(37)-N6)-threonylcarbamoyltransferase complex ATPase subunit type 1 TsaE [Candidatus Tectomicrobia bacterium]|uniref:tRNA threonylcarbamoyladenosine biosynthesis protein TsaE n=1 Tax=Tectimicrobiota bacterium TaxID=2528274 RepID=A0A932GR67_UNCTE|nr:tRNA (adenosine(37)-N6)-threonylcarbamoyltransferase complex ATPase subunit type 1 TsaE [Candidatus Tectomicrobia bacterium]
MSRTIHSLLAEPFHRFVSRDPQETREWGQQFARHLVAGDVVCLYGELGAGKTCLTQGIVAGLGVGARVPVRSPSFTFVREYRGRERILHWDLYRLRSSEEVEELGWRESFDGNAIVLIEWADRVSSLLPQRRWDITLTMISENIRHLEARRFQAAP